MQDKPQPSTVLIRCLAIRVLIQWGNVSLSSRDERLVFSSVNMSEAHKIHQDTVGSRQFGCWTIHRWLLDHLPSGVIKHSWEIRQPNGHFSNIEHHFSLNENCFQFAMCHLFSLTSRYFHLPSEKMGFSRYCQTLKQCSVHMSQDSHGQY